MRSKLLLIAALAALVPAAAWAQTTVTTYDNRDAYNRVGRLDLGVHGAGTFVDASGVDDSGWIGASTSWGLTPGLAIGASGGWTEADGGGGRDVGLADITGDVILRIPAWMPQWNWDTRFVPYAIGGLGAMWGYTDEFDRDDRDDAAFAWKAGGGFDWFLNPNWALNFEATYHSAEDDLPVDAVPADDQEIDFWNVGGGVKFVF